MRRTLLALTLVNWLAALAIVRYAPVAGLTKEEIAEAAAMTLSDPLIITDSERIVTYTNPAVTTLTGFRPDELVGKPVAEKIDQEVANRLALGSEYVDVVDPTNWNSGCWTFLRAIAQ